jgi:hypothetical protein
MPHTLISDDDMRMPDMASPEWHTARVLGKRRREGGEPSTSDEDQVQDHIQNQDQDQDQVQDQVRLLLISDCDLPVCDHNYQGISY